MKIQNWIASVQDRGKWKGVVEKLSTKESSAPGGGGRRRRTAFIIFHIYWLCLGM
jgi:hypothetical protein